MSGSYWIDKRLKFIRDKHPKIDLRSVSFSKVKKKKKGLLFVMKERRSKWRPMRLNCSKLASNHLMGKQPLKCWRCTFVPYTEEKGSWAEASKRNGESLSVETIDGIGCVTLFHSLFSPLFDFSPLMIFKWVVVVVEIWLKKWSIKLCVWSPFFFCQ